MKPNPSSAAIEDTAITWLTERDDGFSPAREREFAQWLRADPRHAATVARLEQTLGRLGEMPAFRAELNTAFDRAAPLVPFPPATAETPAPAARRWPRALNARRAYSFSTPTSPRPDIKTSYQDHLQRPPTQALFPSFGAAICSSQNKDNENNALNLTVIGSATNRLNTR